LNTINSPRAESCWEQGGGVLHTEREVCCKCGGGADKVGALEYYGMRFLFVLETTLALIRNDGLQHVVLVGGFSANDWLFEQIKQSLASQSLTVIRPETHINKAVSDGAVSFYLDHFVRTRISKYTYGSFGNIEYDASDPSHQKRQHLAKQFPSGIKVLPDHFTTILSDRTSIALSKRCFYY
jgi:hypothetical protein